MKAGATSLNECRCLRPDGASLVVDVVLLDGVGDEQLLKYCRSEMQIVSRLLVGSAAYALEGSKNVTESSALEGVLLGHLRE